MSLGRARRVAAPYVFRRCGDVARLETHRALRLPFKTFFRASDWSPLVTFRDAGRVADGAFSRDGRWFVAEAEKKLVVFDARTWRAVGEVGPLSWKTEVSFSPDGCRLVVATGTQVKLIECGS